MQLSVRNINERIFKAFKTKAVKEDLSVGEAMNLAMQLWLEGKKGKVSILDLKPMDFGKGTEKLSKEIDKTLYS